VKALLSPDIDASFAVADFCLPLGTTLQLLARRLDALLHEEGSEEAHADLRRVRALTTEALHTLHDVTETVHEMRVEQADVERILRRIALGVADATGAHVEVRTVGRIGLLPAPAVDILARVTRDALLGLYRHFGAPRMSVRLSVRDNRVVLEVADSGVDPVRNGRRRDPDPARASIARIAEMLGGVGGRLLVGAGDPRGFRLQAVVPLDGSTQGNGGRTPWTSASGRPTTRR